MIKTPEHIIDADDRLLNQTAETHPIKSAAKGKRVSY